MAFMVTAFREVITLLLAPVALVAATVLFFAGNAYAAQPLPWQLGLQPPAGSIAEMADDLHNLLLVVITLISLFVLALLVYVGVRFRASANPVPSKTSHNTVIEILWTVIPVLILVGIAVPSFRLLYYLDKTADTDMVIKVTGERRYLSVELAPVCGTTIDVADAHAKSVAHAVRKSLRASCDVAGLRHGVRVRAVLGGGAPAAARVAAVARRVRERRRGARLRAAREFPTRRPGRPSAAVPANRDAGGAVRTRPSGRHRNSHDVGAGAGEQRLPPE